eukprot:TRINITY_DN1330_c0_g1_i5.p2 TRINITY_DN1330_c0_g1~~TRINITY_DN1330_c0_g1_i5.p2  ORF type:complete len:391 (+),score=106.70 TRINITY_DN1330_c0_g1_i5:251-1423(+)
METSTALVPLFDPTQLPPESQRLLQLAKREVQLKDSEIDAGINSGDDEAGGRFRKRGRPLGSKTLDSYIQDPKARRKYFSKRIRGIQQQAHKFSVATGCHILVVAIQGESGGLHHCGTPPFERFIRDEQVAGVMYNYMMEQDTEAPMPGYNENSSWAPQNTTEIVETPEELLVTLIASKLDTKHLCIGSQVCRAWRVCFYQPSHWRQLFGIEFHPSEIEQVEQAFARVGVHGNLDWRALLRDRYLLEKAHPGCGLLSKFRPRVPGLDSLLMMLVSALQDPNERVESLRWTIVEHFSLFGMHEAWQEADEMISDLFAEPEHLFKYVATNARTFDRFEQYAYMFHNWHVYHLLLTALHNTVPKYRTEALLARAKMVFQEEHTSEWTQKVAEL